MEAIPVVDLRLLTQEEINALSRAFSSSGGGEARRFDDLVVPRIDRSVFNESAGSRKQTYSRLRLAPRKPPDLSTSASYSSVRPSGPSAGLIPDPSLPSTANAADDTGNRENEQIIFFLRQLFAKNDGDIVGASVGSRNENTAVVAANSVANPSPVIIDVEKSGNEQYAAETTSRDDGVLNVRGAAVDLVALGEEKDPFGPEMRRRTHGFTTVEDFLHFLNGLEGQWGSSRKRRKIVDACVFGDALPKGWKLLLALKKKGGYMWLHCRRYISPSGKQFMTCKAVSSYLLSFDESHNGRHQNSAQDSADTSGNGYSVGHNPQMNVTRRNASCSLMVPISSLTPDLEKQIVSYGPEDPENSKLQDVLKCQECYVNFDDKFSLVNHIMSYHGSSKRRRKIGQSICDGVIMRDGKFECQFCHKTFTERRRYNGHVGVHVKYLDRSLELLKNEVAVENIVSSSSVGASSAFSDNGNLVDFEKKATLTEENLEIKPVHELNVPCVSEQAGDTLRDPILRSSVDDEEKNTAHENCTSGATGDTEMQKKTYDNDEEWNVMQESCPLANNGTNNGLSESNIVIEEHKNDDSEFSDNNNCSTQEVCGAQDITQIHASFSPSNYANEIVSRPDFNNEPSQRGFFNIEYGSAKKTPEESFDDGNIKNGGTTTRSVLISPSHSDVSNCTFLDSSRQDIFEEKLCGEIEKSSKSDRNHGNISVPTSQGGRIFSEVAFTKSYGPVVDEIENKICSDGDLNPLPGNDLTTTIDADVDCIPEGLMGMVGCGKEIEDDVACPNKASAGTPNLENIYHGGIQLSGNPMMVPSEETYSNMEPNLDDILHGRGEDLVLDIVGQSSNKLKDDLLGSGGPRNDSDVSIEENMQALQVNMQASWEQTHGHLPMLDMLDQGGGPLHRADGASRREMSCFGDVGLDDIDPGKLAVSPDGEGPATAEGAAGWESVFPDLCLLRRRRRRSTTACVWCGAEFEHDDLDVEVQPDSVGVICPTCKAKISGQI